MVNKELEIYLKNENINLTKQEQDFIIIYFQTNSLPQTKNLLNISIEELTHFYKDPKIQKVIRFLKLERHREIYKTKMLNLEQIGAYLTSYLDELLIPEGDKFQPKDKLEAIKLLIETHKLINHGLSEPTILNEYSSLDNQLQILSINTIKSLINTTSNQNQNNIVENNISLINKDHNQTINELTKLNKQVELEKSKIKLKKDIKKIKK